MYLTAIASTSSLRDRLANFLVNSLTPVYQLIRYKRKAWHTTKTDLSLYASDTLGHGIFQFLNQHDLQLIPKAETHDVWHVLFNYSILMRDEMSIQFVVLGNGKHSAPYLYSCLVALVMYPEHWGSFHKAYLKGKKAHPFYHLEFETLLGENLASLRERIFRQGQ